jgi:NADPH:quinone reductase-like Zn-dependent oxidoreductase
MTSMWGLRAPKIAVPGCDLAGQVEAVGANVTEFRPGDDVYALVRDGGFAEYACVREGLLARKPANMSYEQAAAVPMAAVTALIALRESGRLKSGQAVLVNGASGGVGTFAVQIARALGATVTGVCSARNADLVRSLGADSVVDYTSEDFTTKGRRYDLILDIAGGHSALACRRALTPKGTLVIVGGPPGRWVQPAGHAFGVLIQGMFIPQRVTLTDSVSAGQKRRLLETLSELMETGQVTPVIDRSYPFDDIRAAVKYQLEGHVPGKVVVTIG